MDSTCAVELLTTILTTTHANVGEHWWMSDSGMQLFIRFPISGDRLALCLPHKDRLRNGCRNALETVVR
jgi:hypothetical protein